MDRLAERIREPKNVALFRALEQLLEELGNHKLLYSHLLTDLDDAENDDSQLPIEIIDDAREELKELSHDAKTAASLAESLSGLLYEIWGKMLDGYEYEQEDNE